MSSEYPSERYADIIRVLPVEKQQRVAEYVDEAFHQGDPIATYGVRTWKELVQHLVEFESGTKYAIDQPPIGDYVTYLGDEVPPTLERIMGVEWADRRRKRNRMQALEKQRKDKIAMERFGVSYKELSPGEQGIIDISYLRKEGK